MSFSVCLKCKNMVPHFDKYCHDCQVKFRLPNLPTFQKNWFPQHWENEATKEVQKDIENSQRRKDEQRRTEG